MKELMNNPFNLEFMKKFMNNFINFEFMNNPFNPQIYEGNYEQSL